jgi:excinuclease UvrABC ATPase subunit
MVTLTGTAGVIATATPEEIAACKTSHTGNAVAERAAQ